MKTTFLAIVAVITLASGTAFGQSAKAIDARSLRGHREMHRLMYDNPNAPGKVQTPEEAAAAAAKNHVEGVRRTARNAYAEWTGKLTRPDKVTHTNAKRQATKIAKAEKMTAEDAETYVAEFARQAPIAK